jgi:hypothetical protein
LELGRSSPPVPFFWLRLVELLRRKEALNELKLLRTELRVDLLFELEWERVTVTRGLEGEADGVVGSSVPLTANM